MWRGRGEDVARSEPLGAAGGSAERCLRMWGAVWWFLEKSSEEPPCGPLPHLWVHGPQKWQGASGTCTPTFIATLSTRAERWEQPRCP